MILVTSRYHLVATAQLVGAGHPPIAYLRRRFLPPAGDMALAEHVVTEADRLDTIAAHYLGDPELFWQICDANNALSPDELTAELGRRLIVPLPQ
jgi:hypothetical protein